MNWPLLSNSLLVATLTTIMAVGLGLATALGLTALGGRQQKWALGVAIATLAVPPFLAVNCWLDLLGSQGLFRPWLPAWFKLYSLGGAAGALSLLLWPLSCLATWGAWRRLQAEHLECEPLLQGGSLIRWLLWPAARKALGLSAAMTFVLSLGNFAVPAILQVKVLPAEIWIEYNARLDSFAALRVGWPLVAAPALFLWWLWQREELAWPRLGRGLPDGLFRRQLTGRWLWPASVIGSLAAILGVGVPLIQLVGKGAVWMQFFRTLGAEAPVLWNTFALAAVTATVTVALGVLSAGPVGRVHLRVKQALACAVWLPFFVPGILVGLSSIWLLNRPATEWFYQGVGTMLLALAVRYAGPGWHGAVLARAACDRDLLDAARLHGARGWRFFKLAVWPQAAPQFAVSWYVVYLLCLWDVETLVLVQQPGRETLALRIFNLLHYGHTDHVNALCLWLLVLAVTPLAVWQAIHWLLRGRGRSAWTLLALAAVLAATGCKPPANDRQAPIKSALFERVLVIGERGSAFGQFSKPRSVAVDRDDNLYVVDMTGRVQKFSPDGRFLLSWQMPETDLGKAKGMGLDKDGNIIVVEPHYQRLNHFTPDGKLVEQWGVKGTNAGQFILPRAVQINSRGDVFVSEYTGVDRVQAFDGTTKRLLASWGQIGPGPGQFNRAEGLGIDAADRVYVADSCNHRIQVFDAQGRFLKAFGKPGAGLGELSYPYDVRVDAQGYRYVCEFGNSRIQVFDAQNRPVEIIGGPGSKPGQFSNPWGIAFDSQGNLYVADSGNHRVQKLVRDYSRTTR